MQGSTQHCKNLPESWNSQFNAKLVLPGMQSNLLLSLGDMLWRSVLVELSRGFPQRGYEAIFAPRQIGETKPSFLDGTHRLGVMSKGRVACLNPRLISLRGFPPLIDDVATYGELARRSIMSGISGGLSDSTRKFVSVYAYPRAETRIL
jgi:hypothetical protein